MAQPSVRGACDSAASFLPTIHPAGTQKERVGEVDKCIGLSAVKNMLNRRGFLLTSKSKTPRISTAACLGPMRGAFSILARYHRLATIASSRTVLKWVDPPLQGA